MNDRGLAVFDWSMVDLTPGVCVHRGAMHLDKWFSGWALRVDLSTLDVQSTEACPLAQASGETWFDAPERDYGPDWMIAHGFAWTLLSGDPCYALTAGTIARITDLNRMWRVQVAARQLEGQAT